MKNIFKKLAAFITAAAISISFIMAMPISASAADGEMALTVSVKNSKSATATISNISVPLTMDYKYEGYEGSHCAFYYCIIFGDFGVDLNVTAKKLMSYAEETGETSIPLSMFSPYVVSCTRDGDSFSTSSLDDCNITFSATSSSITFDFTFADGYDIDMTKLTSYDVSTFNVGDYKVKSFSAKNGIVITENEEKNGGKISDMEITGIADKTYTGKSIEQSIVIKDGSYTLKKGTDYTASYKNNKNIGKATVIIKGKGEYTGSVTKTFKINPKKVSLSSVKETKGSVKLVWSSQAGVTGYEIYYSTEKNGKYKKLTTVKGASKKTYTAKNLADGTYYFKVRAYKTVDKTSYYGAYSSVKQTTIGKTDSSWDGVYSFEQNDGGEITGIILKLYTSGDKLNYSLQRYDYEKINVTFEMYNSFNLSNEKNSTFTGDYVDMRSADAGMLISDATFSITKISNSNIKLTVNFPSTSYSYTLTK